MRLKIHSPTAQAALRRAARAAAATLSSVGERLRPGLSTAQIDRWVRDDTKARGGTPSQLGFHGFPAAVCVSVNDIVCHGVPSRKVRLEPGDVVNIDVTTCIDGYHGDTAATFIVGRGTPEATRVVDAARACRDAGIAVIREGARLGEIGAAIRGAARRAGCSVVKEFGGHGIGRQMHERGSYISYTDERDSDYRLEAGMVFTVEPMINAGRPDVELLEDGWSVATADGRLSAQFEHTVLVTKTGYEVLSDLVPLT